MSGIAGMIASEQREKIAPIVRAMAYRGSAGERSEGTYNDARITLCQLRLPSVISAAERTPLASEDGRLRMVADGEIYNATTLRGELEGRGHRFQSARTIETALHLYEEQGVAALKRLRGAFAIAIWDSQEGTLLLARDQMGQKPLFYAQSESGFFFASEVKGVLAADLVERRVDLDGLWHYMSLRFIPDKYTLFKGVQKLPAATWLLRTAAGKISDERYWDLDFRQKMEGSEADLIERLDQTLTEVVKSQMPANGSFGSFLSGGIDSSLITAIMAKTTDSPFPTFSIGVKEQRLNELPWARMVSERYRLQGREKIVEADLVNLMPTMISFLDEPSDPFGVGVYLVAREAAQEVQTVLSGDGGDENFAGYDRFAGQKLVDYYAWLPVGLRRQLFGRLIALVPESFTYKSLAGKLKWLHTMSFFDAGRRYAESMSFLRFTNEHKEQLFSSDAKAALSDSDSLAKILTHFNSRLAEEPLDRMLNTDLMTRMPDHLLTLSDRMTMAHSLEARAPLIDQRVTEFAAALPAAMKLKPRSLKHMLRRVSERYLPRELIYRPKQGFGFPIARWLRDELRDFTRNLLLRDSRFVANGLFDVAYVRKLVDEHQEGRADHNFRLWILLNLEIWHRLYFENSTVDSCRELIARLSR